ncbi:TadE family type IV pilus minor pilin [Catenulispora rubra]|uniref:TadE family type IV pilus minor pilin n=1 Tax=Catenulispora rubra TaxID=280293 RepID=UPI0018923FFF|nr:TadE family type IV pilus minor pilin [Catenulispora rubra]
MHRRRRRDAGYATVEAALAIPSLVLFTVALAGVLTGLATQIRCLDAARLGARAAARGESAAEVGAAVGRALPGASVRIGTEDGLIHVTVSAPVAEVPLLRAFTVHADAYEADETTVGSEDTHADPDP